MEMGVLNSLGIKRVNNEEEGNKELIPFSELSELNIPTNENLRKSLEPNLKGVITSGGSLLNIVEDMIKEKCYRQMIDNVIIWIRAAEDIAKDLIRDVDYKKIGITGSDFLIEQLYGLPTFGLTEVKEGKYFYITPVGLVKDNLPVGKIIKFEGEDSEGKKIIEAIILNYNTSPKLCILGPNDDTLHYLKKRKKEERGKIKSVGEERFYNIHKAFMENDTEISQIGYTIENVIRTTEGYIKKSKDEKGRADIGMEIGETFKTAISNGLILYKKIMPTYPILLWCHRPQQSEFIFS